MIQRNKILSHLLTSIIIVIVVIVFLWFVLRLFNVTFDAKGGEAIVLAFFGILATFVVVGNYSQVSSIKDEVRAKINEMDDDIQDTNAQLPILETAIETKWVDALKKSEKKEIDIINGKIQEVLEHAIPDAFHDRDANIVLTLINLLSNDKYLKIFLDVYNKKRKIYSVTYLDDKGAPIPKKTSARINQTDYRLEFYTGNQKDGYTVYNNIKSVGEIVSYDSSIIDKTLYLIFSQSNENNTNQTR